MARRSKKVQIHFHECTMTGETFKTTRKAPNPDELVSVEAYYEMYPEKDDRPENIKKEVAEKKGEL
jgi:hypothetical protein